MLKKLGKVTKNDIIFVLHYINNKYILKSFDVKKIECQMFGDNILHMESETEFMIISVKNNNYILQDQEGRYFCTDKAYMYSYILNELSIESEELEIKEEILSRELEKLMINEE